MLRKPTGEDIAKGADPDRRVLYGWRTGNVFDIGQAEAARDDALEYPQLGGEGYIHLYDKLKAAARSIGQEMIEDPATTTEGYCAFRGRSIDICTGMTAASKAATLTPELAYALAHNPAEQNDSERLSHAARELQAEGAAYLACYAMGLDTAVVLLPYAKHYERDGETVEAHLKVIDRIAWRIVDSAR